MVIKNPKLGGSYRAFGSEGTSQDENDTDDAIINKGGITSPNEITTNQTLDFGSWMVNGNSKLDLSLPTNAEIGDTIELINKGGGYKIIQGDADQQIFYLDDKTTKGIDGYLLSSENFANVNLVYGGSVIVGWTDISIASYDSVNFNDSSRDAMNGLFFKPDGTKMFTCGTVGDDVYEYDLSTAWDVSSASFSTSFDVSGQEGFPMDIAFKDDGTKMYMIGDGNDTIYEYDLSTAWDVSSATYNSVSFSVTGQGANPVCIAFKDDGTKFFTTTEGDNSVNEYTLTAWDLSTASYDSSYVVSEESNPSGVAFKDDGTKMYVVGSNNDTIYQYTLSTAWNVGTASYDSVSFSVASETNHINMLFFRNDGTKFYIIYVGIVYQYSLGLSADKGWIVRNIEGTHTIN